ncbi:flavodoxin, partial [Dysosmobacter welbionis]
AHQFLAFPAAVQAGQKQVQFRVADRRHAPVTGGPIHSHLQRIRHIEDRIPIGDLELIVCSIHVHVKGLQDNRLVKWVDRTGHILHRFLRLPIAPFILYRDLGTLHLISDSIHLVGDGVEFTLQICLSRSALAHGGRVGSQDIAG